MFCNKCGKELKDNVKFCTGCGAAVGAAPPQRVMQQQPLQQPGQRPPQQSGPPLQQPGPPPQQSAQQSPPQRVCQSCGTTLRTNSKFCPGCGATVGAVPVQQPVIQQPAPPQQPPQQPIQQPGPPPQQPLMQPPPQQPIQQSGLPPQQPAPQYKAPPPPQQPIMQQPGQPPAQPQQYTAPPQQPPQQYTAPLQQQQPGQPPLQQQPGYQQPAGQPPQQQQQPGYQRPPQQQPAGQQPAAPRPKKKKSNKLLAFGVTGAIAAALAVVFALYIFPMLQKDPVSDIDNGDDPPVVVNEDDTGDGGVVFEPGEDSFTTNDPQIKMIEVNQGLSYGYNTNTGNFYLLSNFVAGKETGIFIDLDEPFDHKADVRLAIEKNDEPLVTLRSYDVIDDYTLLFHPKDMYEVDNWGQGAYTFTFMMDDSVAVRTTNFHKSMPMKVLAVPIKGNYTNDVRSCGDDWKQGSTMLSAVFPVARADVEYILGPEQDYSSQEYDLNRKDGRKKVWQALCALQTPNNDYTMIVGFMATPTMQGYLGYTYGGEATVVCESEPDLLATVVHEIAHCYKIGDEYKDGSINDILNPPPYGMKGKDILTGEPAEGTKEHVISGDSVGVKGSGSVIYPEQRAYWPEGRQVLGTITSYMSSGNGEDSFAFWTTSDIWNHLFKVFTGQMTGREVGYGTAGDGSEPGNYWGQCFECFGEVYDPDRYVECNKCAKMIKISGESFDCSDCGATYSERDVDEYDMWLYHDACGYLLNYPKFVEHNQGESQRTVWEDEVAVLEIRGSFSPSGAFSTEPWYSYNAGVTMVTATRDGAYSASVFDENGTRLSIVFFDARDDSQINTREGYKWGAGEDDEDTDIPIKVIIKYPENAAKIVIHRGDEEVYTRNLTARAPQVAFTGLTEGQILDNHTTLTWEVSDADPNELSYRIWYYRSAEEMYLVASDITGTSYDADLTDFPGGDHCWFEILASDGSRTSTGTSPKVSVPYRAPDILNHIPDGTQYKLTDLIEIHGKVYDAQDGWLWFREYTWYVDGKYDSDYAFFIIRPYTMAPGVHTITMVVTNSAGVSSTKDFVIEILEYDLDLPEPWPKLEITIALGQGYYQPLDKLDAPITRIEFAKMMFYFYMEGIVLSWQEDLPDDVVSENMDLMVEFYDMSNDITDPDMTYALQMMWLGLMELKNPTYEYYGDFTVAYGDFDPHGLLTEREAMQIMYMAIELSRTQTYVETYEVLDESVFLPTVKEWGMFDETGFNAYNPDGRMSKGLSMVRIARFIIYLYETLYGTDPTYLDPEFLYGYD